MSSVRPSAAMVDSPGAMSKVSTVAEIKPLDQYDFSRAKICASVRWLLSKSYGSAGTSARAAAWVGRVIIKLVKCKPEVSLKHLKIPTQTCGDLPLHRQCSGWIIADEEPIILITLFGEGGCGGFLGCGMRDAWRILSSPQRNKAYCQRIRPGDGSRCNPEGANTSLETVEKVAGKRDKASPSYLCQCYARTLGWSAGQRAEGDILDNGEKAAQGFSDKKVPGVIVLSVA